MTLSPRTAAVSTPAAVTADSGSRMAMSTPAPTPWSEASVSVVEEEPDGMVSAQSITAEEVVEAAEESTGKAMSAAADVVVEEEPEDLPVSGGREPVNPLVVALPILLVAGLALAGWRSWGTRT